MAQKFQEFLFERSYRGLRNANREFYASDHQFDFVFS